MICVMHILALIILMIILNGNILEKLFVIKKIVQ